MSNSIECPEPEGERIKKLNMMRGEFVKVVCDEQEGQMRGMLQAIKPDVWQVGNGERGFARFKIRNVVAICPKLITIKIEKK
jgi:hypothetical protein